MLVYRVINDPDDPECINVHTAYANSKISNANAEQMEKVQTFVNQIIENATKRLTWAEGLD